MRERERGWLWKTKILLKYKRNLHFIQNLQVIAKFFKESLQIFSLNLTGHSLNLGELVS